MNTNDLQKVKSSARFVTGFAKFLLYARIALKVALRYTFQLRRFKWSPKAYLCFLARAMQLLFVFRHNKPVCVKNGWKLDLYLPAYPSRAFFYALESKLMTSPPRPVTVVFSMTKACSYTCPHCYQRKDGGADIPDELLIKTAREIQDMGVAMFDIEGGEPFLRFSRLLKLIRSIDSRSEIWVNTTGTGFKPDILHELADAGLFGLMISLHSPDAAKHDAMTGIKGSFDIACQAFKISRDIGLVCAVNSVLSEEEISCGGLKKLMELARELDSDFVQLIHPKPAGLWMGRSENMQRSEKFIDGIRKFHSEYAVRKSYPSLVAQVFEESEAMLGCTGGGVDRFYVNAGGEVQPCEFLNISFGNVKDEPFGEIFKRMRSYFDIPCSDWLCCTQAEAISELFQKYDFKQTPLPWSTTKLLVQQWNRGRPTPLYRKLGIYK